ncbi:putative permease YjgP/YjgQ family protein [Pirellula sp. SH-Sr6A]|uniref:LptF/LptG family permease n=1 Tax=Pirellula sp. SH-Sr6A TaxID=1632865 RepID=UPI00078DEF15|nr:LptF/LptG family permease [Pirellula sp. SH-Sr6A]AMV35150.1 putative permease YjgP/YjgQ family protein [Pirellula sp. SH-Sr6A]
MTQIDRYVLFLYGRVFVVCFLTLSGLLIVVQLFTNVDEFVMFGKAQGGFARGLLAYFGPQMISLFDRLCGLITLLATMFVFAWLSRTNELTAILAAGVSKGRIATPLILASLLMIGFAAILRETAIPRFSEILSKTPPELTGETIEPLKPAEDHDRGILVVGRHTIPAKRLIINPAFKFTGPPSAVTRQILGEQAEYVASNDKHPSGYLIRNFQSAEPISGLPSVRKDDRVYLYLPSDTPWLAPTECFVPSDLEFDLLLGGGAKQFASTAELVWRVKNQSAFFGADMQVMVHSRFLQPFLDFTQLLIGIPLILSTRNRNLVSMIASCVVSYAIFFGLSIGIRTLGANGTLLTPAAAAWTPLLIFAPIAWTRTRSAMDS